MSRPLTRWLVAVLLVAAAVSPNIGLATQVVRSFSDEDDPAYPIGVVSEDDEPPAAPSASDRLIPQPATPSPVVSGPVYSLRVASDGCADSCLNACSNACSGCLACCGACDVPRHWISAEYLMWWTKGNQLPALVTTSPTGTPQAAAGVLPGATTLFGGGQIDDDLRNGLRLTYGHWADPDGTVGWQASYFSVFDDENTGDYANGTTGGLAGAGAPILARPFFNASLGIEDARLISFPGRVNGNIAINSSSEMHSVSWMLRQHLRSGSRGRVDLLGGYRYFRFREGLTINESLVSTGGAIPAGTTIAISDRFLAENDFHGGDLGFAAEFWNQGWSLELLAKVALGNLRRSSEIFGSTVTDTPPAGGGVTTSGGLLAAPTNIGRRSANDFAALPEFGLNVKFEASRSVAFNFGYTLLMLNDVARTGEQIDRRVNPTQLSGGALVGAARPSSQFGNETDFWAQGLNFGVTFTR